MNELVEKVRELGFKVSKRQIVTIKQFARLIMESADFDKHTITPCDFATTDEDDPDEAYERASGWPRQSRMPLLKASIFGKGVLAPIQKSFLTGRWVK